MSSIYNHLVFTLNKCPKGCGMNEKHVLEDDCLSCQCGWPEEIRGEEIEDFDDSENECSYCNGYGETYDDSDLQEPHKECDKCCGTGFI